MTFAQTLAKCSSALEGINASLMDTHNGFSCVLDELSKKDQVSIIEKKYDLITLARVEEMQDLMSKQAIPFLYRQVEQLENVLEAESLYKEQALKELEEAKQEYNDLVLKDKQVNDMNSKIKALKLELEDMQAIFLELQSANSTKERQITTLQRRIDENQKRVSLGIETIAEEKENKIKQLKVKLEGFESTSTSSTGNMANSPSNTSNILLSLKQHVGILIKEGKVSAREETLDKGILVVDELYNSVIRENLEASSRHKQNKQRYLARLLKQFYAEQSECVADMIDILASKIAARISLEEVEKALLGTYTQGRISDALNFLGDAGIVSVYSIDGEYFVSLKMVNSV